MVDRHLGYALAAAALILLASFGTAAQGAPAKRIVIDENGHAAFSDGSPIFTKDSSFSLVPGTIVLCDGGTEGTVEVGKCPTTDSDILVFGSSTRSITFQSDESTAPAPGELAEPPFPIADKTSFTLQIPANAVFLDEGAANPSGIERVDWNPVGGQPGFFTINGTPVQYQIISDGPVVTAEPSSWAMLLAGLVCLSAAARRRLR